MQLSTHNPIPREIPLMNPGEGFFRSSDEAFAVALDHGPFRPSAQAGDGFAAVAAGADDVRHLPGDDLAVSRP